MAEELRFNILVVDDVREQREQMQLLLEEWGEVITAASLDDVLRFHHQQIAALDVAFIDYNLSRAQYKNGWEVGRRLRYYNKDVALVMITGELKSSDDADRSHYEHGFFRHLQKPLSEVQVNRIFSDPVVRSIARRRQVLGGEKIISRSPAMDKVLNLVGKVAPSDTTVLVTGESGTGKELIARAIHEASHRGDSAFVPVNCTAVTETLLESELFGHVKGAFTNALVDKKGLLEEAHGGTLFFDEIGDVNGLLQVKLLRAIQEKRVKRVGAATETDCDFRLIAATNQDLEAMVKNRLFREDLYFRLNVFRIKVPPLRERMQDVPILFQHFVERFAIEMGKAVPRVSEQALQLLLNYQWPGNVREVENCARTAVVMMDEDTIVPSLLPDAVVAAQHLGVSPLITEAEESRTSPKSSVRVPSSPDPAPRAEEAPEQLAFPKTRPSLALLSFIREGGKLFKFTDRGRASLEAHKNPDGSLKPEAFTVEVQYATYDSGRKQWCFQSSPGGIEEVMIAAEMERMRKKRGSSEKIPVVQRKSYGSLTIDEIWRKVQSSIAADELGAFLHLPWAIAYYYERQEKTGPWIVSQLYDPVCAAHAESLRVQLFPKEEYFLEQMRHFFTGITCKADGVRRLLEHHGLAEKGASIARL